MTYQISPAGTSLIRAMESCRLSSYQDQGGVWTIGWGHTGLGVRKGLVWTQAQADAQLATDLAVFSAGVSKLVAPNLTANQFSALVSLGYNIGLAALAGSSALHFANEGAWSSVPFCIAKWDKITVEGRLVVDRGLVGRRACECALFGLKDGSPIPDWDKIRSAAE